MASNGKFQGREVVIVEAVRTPIGRGHEEKGYYKDVHASSLLARTYKELVDRAGIEPSEVEDVLSSLPGVQDCAVVGVPDRYLGERVAAYVVRAPGHPLTEHDAVTHCAAELAAYKVPRSVEFRESLPRTPVGKVRRRQLAEQGRAAQAPDERVRKTSRPDGR